MDCDRCEKCGGCLDFAPEDHERCRTVAEEAARIDMSYSEALALGVRRASQIIRLAMVLPSYAEAESVHGAAVLTMGAELTADEFDMVIDAVTELIILNGWPDAPEPEGIRG